MRDLAYLVFQFLDGAIGSFVYNINMYMLCAVSIP